MASMQSGDPSEEHDSGPGRRSGDHERPGVSTHLPPEGSRASATSEKDVAREIRDAAVSLGFAKIGFAPVERFDDAAERLDTWLAAGHAGEMQYLASSTDRADPRHLLAEARTSIVAVLVYPKGRPVKDARGRLVGNIARYARGQDYHAVFKQKLRELGDECARIVGRPVVGRACVDTAPMLEREAAARAGIGFIAKSTMNIVPGIGTYTLIGELLIDVEIAPGERLEPKCGTCTACLDACPTGAFVDAYTLDARRCISYLTIELRGPIPVELRSKIGERIFGCDVCQDVCPFNASAADKPSATELSPRPSLESPDLVELLELSSSGYRRVVEGTALRRVSRARLARNAAVALGNSKDPRARPALERALSHASPLVRGHAAWALGELGGEECREALERAAASDESLEVRQEASCALERLSPVA